MTLTYDRFLDRYTKTRKDGSFRILAIFKDHFGNVSLEEAYESELKRIAKIDEREAKIRRFENFLIEKGARCENSNISESRYYYYDGKKYRFSAHVYPTGSMTDEVLGVVDLAADTYLIDTINF